MARPHVVVITGASAGVGRATAPAFQVIPLQAPCCGAGFAILGILIRFFV